MTTSPGTPARQRVTVTVNAAGTIDHLNVHMPAPPRVEDLSDPDKGALFTLWFGNVVLFFDTAAALDGWLVDAFTAALPHRGDATGGPCGHDGWTAGCAHCEAQHAEAVRYVDPYPDGDPYQGHAR